MFLKLFSANLRSAVSVCNVVSTKAGQPILTSTYKFANQIVYTKLQYTTNKPAGTTSKRNDKIVASELSHDEIQILNQNPDDFGTLSSFKPSDTLKQSNQSNEIVQEKSISRISNPQSIEQYEILLKTLINEKRTQDAVNLFEKKMLKDRILIPVHIFEWLIDECLHCKQYANAFDLYEHMVNRSLKISTEILEKIAQSFELSNLPLRKAFNLRKFISKGKCQPSEKTYNALVRIHIRADQWQGGLELADEMKQHNFHYEYDTLYLILIGFSHDKKHGFYRMLELWHEMRRLNHKPDVHIFNALLKCVLNCELNDVEKLQETLESIKKKNQIAKKAISLEIDENAEKSNGIDEGRPNLLNDPPAIGRLFPMANVKTPEHRLLILGGLSFVLNLFKTYNITPMSDTVTTLLNVTPNTFFAQQKVISLLNKNNIIPDSNFFDTLLMRCCLRQSFNDAQEVIELMRTYDMQVDLVTYGLLSMSCKTANDAAKYFDDIYSHRIELNVDIMSAMLKNACRTGNNDFVISILRKMQSNRIEPTDEMVDMVKNYQKDVIRKLRYETSHSKKTRNECFKLTRECRQWHKHFRLDKNATHEKDSSIETSTQATKSKLGKHQPNRVNVKHNESSVRKEENQLD